MGSLKKLVEEKNKVLNALKKENEALAKNIMKQRADLILCHAKAQLSGANANLPAARALNDFLKEKFPLLHEEASVVGESAAIQQDNK